jgi:hypothetical protein
MKAAWFESFGAAVLAAVSAIFDAPEMPKSWRLSSIYTKHGSQNDNVNI